MIHAMSFTVNYRITVRNTVNEEQKVLEEGFFF
jgi:hypothetical protein